jgi:hypothetical protein
MTLEEIFQYIEPHLGNEGHMVMLEITTEKQIVECE